MSAPNNGSSISNTPGGAHAAYERSRLHTQLFCIVWAIATLFHLIATGDQAEEFSSMVLWCGALFILVAPHRRWSLPLLAAIQLFECFGHMPWVSNHWMTTGWVNLLVLVCSALATWHAAQEPSQTTGQKPDQTAARDWRSHFFRYFQGPLLALVGILYFYAVFHKLNFDFFDPQYSCATSLYHKLQRYILPALPSGSWVDTVCIVGTLVVEALIPILIIVPKTRRMGVVIAIAFHTMLASIPVPKYYNFSAMLCALFVGCMNSDDARTLMLRIQGRWQHWSEISALKHLSPDLLRIAVLVLGLLIWGRSHVEKVQDTFGDLARYVFLFYGSFVAVAVASLGLRLNGASKPVLLPKTAALPPRATLRWVIPLLFFLNGACPYLGLKTELSLSMYSNLKTENHESNHALIREPLDLLGWQNDIVTVQASSSKRLRRYKRKKRAWPWIEFRDYLARYPKYSATYRRGNKVLGVKAKEREAEFADPMPWWQRKFIRFRSFQLGGRQRCLH